MVDYLPSPSRMTTKLNKYYHRNNNTNNKNNHHHTTSSSNNNNNNNSNNDCTSCPTCSTTKQTTTTTTTTKNEGKNKYNKIFRRVSRHHHHQKTKPNHQFNDDNDNERVNVNDIVIPIVVLPPPLSSEVDISTNPFDTVDTGDDHYGGGGGGGVTLMADEQCDTNPFSRDDDSWDNDDNKDLVSMGGVPATIIPPPMDVDEKKGITTNPFDDDQLPNNDYQATLSTTTTTKNDDNNVNNKRIIGPATDNNHPPSSEQKEPNDDSGGDDETTTSILTTLSHPKTPLPDILQIITHHPHNSTIQNAGYQRLKHLSRSLSNKRMILSNDDVISIISSTITCTGNNDDDDDDEMILAFGTLCSLTSRNDSLPHDNTTAIKKINQNTLHLISLILSTMTRHPSNKAIQSMGCDALLNLTFDCHYLLHLKSLHDNDDNDDKSSHLRRVLTRASQNYPQDCALSCQVITERLNFGVDEALEMIRSMQKKGGDEMIMKDIVTLLTVPSLMTSSSVHYAGCVAIDAIVAREEEEGRHCSGWIDDDDDEGNDYSALLPSDFAIIHVVMNAMERHGTTTKTMSSLQSLGCAILRRLCDPQRLTKDDCKRTKHGRRRRRRQGWENATVVITCEGWELITKGMKMHSKVMAVQKEGCLLMHCLMEAKDRMKRGDDDDNDGGDKGLIVVVREREMKSTKRVLKAAKKNYPGECGDLVDKILSRLRRRGKDDDVESSSSSSHFRVKVF